MLRTLFLNDHDRIEDEPLKSVWNCNYRTRRYTRS